VNILILHQDKNGKREAIALWKLNLPFRKNCLNSRITKKSRFVELAKPKPKPLKLAFRKLILHQELKTYNQGQNFSTMP